MRKTDIKDKVKILFLPATLTLLTLSIGYPLVVWVFVIKLGWLNIRSGALEFGLPILLAHIVYLSFLKNRFHLLRLKTKKRSETAHFAVGMGSIIFLSLPVIVATTYVLKSSYKLVELSSPLLAHHEDNERYYKFSKMYFDDKYSLTLPEVHTSGKHNQNLELSYYITCPILNEKDNYPTGKITHWYGVKYHKTISNRESDYRKEELYNEFIKQSEEKWSTDDKAKFVYLERVRPSNDLDNYYATISQLYYSNTEKSVFFEPKHEPFENRLGENYQWIFYSFGVSFFWFTIFSFAPKFSALRIYKYKRGEKIVDNEFNSFFKYFVPNGEHYVTSILIDLCIAYFLIMLMCGAGFMYSDVDKLINLGGVGYNEVAIGQYWRIITGLFVHANIIHLVYNMIGLAIGGLFLEKMIITIFY